MLFFQIVFQNCCFRKLLFFRNLLFFEIVFKIVVFWMFFRISYFGHFNQSSSCIWDKNACQFNTIYYFNNFIDFYICSDKVFKPQIEVITLCRLQFSIICDFFEINKVFLFLVFRDSGSSKVSFVQIRIEECWKVVKLKIWQFKSNILSHVS